MSNLPVEQLRQLKVGDVVTIEKDIFGGRPKLVTAPIIKIEKRWGSNALPMITLEGHDPNWLGKAGEGPFFDRCFEQGAHMVVRVDKIGHYKVQSKSARNAFEEHMDNQSERPWLNPRDEQPKGVLYGHYGNMDFLFIYALSKLNYDFDDRAYSPEKARMCWEKAGRPGFIRQPEPEKVGGRKDFEIPSHLYVSEKHFCAFVRRNWTRVLCTRKEMDIDADERSRIDAEAWDEAIGDLEEVLDRKMGYPGDEDDRVRWAEDDLVEEEAFRNGSY